ncbi:hypothetical protein HYV22_01460 [Candidatus Gottesmanbacteria bacterium]|nr:hypothetical protein [Candidatus Gottesmanbacteria bacterium]
MVLIILLAELVVLYFLSRHMSQLIYGLFLFLFRHRSLAVTATTILFFPGTVVHELAHLFTAEVLGVHTGKLSLVPENLEEEEVQAGSVQIAKTDPFRRYVIGFAPLFVGITIIAAISYFIRRPFAVYPELVEGQGDALQNALIYGTGYYLLFVISNSMFSSKEDLKGFIAFAIAITLLLAAGYVAGIRIGLTGTILEFINRILDALVKSTGLVLVINGVLLLIIRILLSISGKIFRRKIKLS